MKVLITNPPCLFNKYILFGRRFGIRAGSRWPFSYSTPNFITKIPYLIKLMLSSPKGFCKKVLTKINLRLNKNTLTENNLPYCPYPGFMGYATSYLQSKGIETKFYDTIALGHNYSIFYKTIDRFKPDLVIQETSTPSFNIDLEIAKKLHKRYEVCLVGPHATAFAEELIDLPFVDYILKGAYEYSAWEMIKTKRKGIYDYRFADLDDLPYPYRDESIIHLYRDYNVLKDLAFPQLWIYASRGCIFHCDFCLWIDTMFNNKLSLRQAENVLGEIDDMVSKYNFRHIYFDDDCWNIGPEERLMKIAEGLHRIGLPWTINARLDTSNKEAFKYFVDRGCVGLRLGIESLSQTLLDRINKKLSVKEVIDTLEFLKTLNVSLYLCFMHYLPGETEEDRAEHNGKLKKIGIRYQNPSCIPFPGTPYYQKIIQAGYNLEKEVSWEEFDGGRIGQNLLNLIKEYSNKINDIL